MAGKGPAYEREICKRLSNWWTNGEEEFVFWRSSNSGGKSTMSHRRGKASKQHNGDICAVDPIGEPFMKAFTIEIKRGYKNSSIGDVLDKADNAKQQIWESWYQQVTEAQERSGSKYWLIISKRDKRKAIVYFDWYAYRELKHKFEDDGYYQFARLQLFVRCDREEKSIGVDVDCVCMSLDRFLEHVNSEDIRRLAK